MKLLISNELTENAIITQKRPPRTIIVDHPDKSLIDKEAFDAPTSR